MKANSEKQSDPSSYQHVLLDELNSRPPPTTSGTTPLGSPMARDVAMSLKILYIGSTT
jgi:hypothetical protein